MTDIIITTCKGRLEHLKQALPTWLAHTSCQIIVVDYGCPDRTAQWAFGLNDERVFVIQPAAALEPGATFSKARAINAALSLVLPEKKIVLLDADTLVPTGVFAEVAGALNPGRFLVAEPSIATRDLTGVLVARAGDLQAIGGFDEGMSGWGAEDLDVRMRLLLHARLTPEWFPAGMLEWIDHDDELRTRHYAEKDKELSNRVNTARIFQKMCSSLDEVELLVRDTTVRRLLGSGLERRAPDPAK